MYIFTEIKSSQSKVKIELYLQNAAIIIMHGSAVTPRKYNLQTSFTTM